MRVIYYTAGQVRYMQTMGGWEVTDPEDVSHDDLGQIIALWQVSTTDEGKVFDLVDLEARASTLVANEAKDLCTKLTLDAFRLPENAFVVICFPNEEGTDGGTETASPPGDEPG